MCPLWQHLVIFLTQPFWPDISILYLHDAILDPLIVCIIDLGRWYINIQVYKLTLNPNPNILLIYYSWLPTITTVLVAQSCLTLDNSIGCRPPGSTVHGLLQARVLKIPFPRRSSQPRDRTHVSWIVGTFFTVRATRGAPSTIIVSDGILHKWFLST